MNDKTKARLLFFALLGITFYEGGVVVGLSLCSPVAAMLWVWGYLLLLVYVSFKLGDKWIERRRKARLWDDYVKTGDDK